MSASAFTTAADSPLVTGDLLELADETRLSQKTRRELDAVHPLGAVGASFRSVIF
jgi:hypothetical protein